MTYPNDPNLDGRSRAEPASRSSMPWILGGAAAVALIAFLAFSMANRSDVSQNAATPPASNSTTTTGSGAPGGAATQRQGQTGPLNTGSGGAPAASPQGETPPNMQSNPSAPTSR
jgi:hypothetical protein